MRLAMLTALAGVAACAAGSTGTRTTTAGSADDSDMICRHETRSGSTITHKVCQTREQATREHLAGVDYLRARRARR